MRLIAVVGACFIAGTGGGTVLHMRGAAQKAAEAALHADTVHVDSMLVADAHGETGPGEEAPHAEDAASTDTVAAPADAHDATATATHAPEPVAATVAHVDSAAASDASESAARLARIFGAMKPEEAARLLEPLPEGDVRAVLFALSDRKAAAILANFKGERATVLARALIGNGGGH